MTHLPTPAPLPTTEPADGVLVAAARRGEMKAFEALYRMHAGKVMGLCLRLAGKHHDAEDCVQQTFIKAWRNLHSFAGRSSFATWLHSIAVHVVMEQKRSRKAWLETGGDALADRQLDAQAEHDGQFVDIENLIMSLPEGARCVVVLQGIYGYSHEEVAAMLGIAVGTCKAQLHRARALLRARYESKEQP